MDKEKARKIYSGKKSVPDASKYPEIEAVFFEDNSFVPCFKITLPGAGRSFYISKDDRFYFSPSYFNNKKFEIHDCKKIKSAELVVVGSTSSALTGALIAGAAGAIAGADNKAHNYAIRVDLDDPQCPVVFGLMYVAPIRENDPAYQNIVVQAAKITNKLKEYIKKEEPAPSATSDDFMAKLEKIMAMKQAGLLTDEEFIAAKAKLLQ